MKTGLSLTEVVVELERQAKTKRDFICDTRRLSMAPDGSTLQGVNGGMLLRQTAHQQLGLALGIPKPYYDRLRSEAPDLLATNVNRWLEQQPAKKMVRSLDGEVRAILSDSYRPLDNLDLATAVLPKLMKLHATVHSTQITEDRFYVKAVTERVQGEVKVGDIVQAGLVVSNSEVGLGSLRVEALDYRLLCLNGMIRDNSIRKAHLGRRNRGEDDLEEAREFFRDETRALEDRTFFHKVQDAVGGMFDQGKFDRRLQQYRGATAQKMEAPPDEVVEITAKRLQLNDDERGLVLRHLIEGADLSKWGLANAVTRAAQDVESYDRSTAMEKLGGDIIELSPNDWRVLAA